MQKEITGDFDLPAIFVKRNNSVLLDVKSGLDTLNIMFYSYITEQ
jgi:hypothetical protein